MLTIDGRLPAYLTRREAARLLQDHGYPVALKTLAGFASRGGGPAFARFGGRSLYRADDVLAWAQARLRPAGGGETPSTDVPR
jgi:hypothetical protein